MSCGVPGHGWDGLWCQLDCFRLLGGCLWVEHQDEDRWASWCPFCGAGVSNELPS